MNVVVVRFTLLAPTVGTIAFLATEMIHDDTRLALSFASVLPAAQHLASDIGSGIGVGFLGLFLGYPIGLIPAFCSSLIYWISLRHVPDGRLSLARRVMVGAIGGLLSAGTIGGLLFSTGQDGRWMPSLIIPWAYAGLLGGAVSAMVVGRGSFAIAREGRGTPCV